MELGGVLEPSLTSMMWLEKWEVRRITKSRNYTIFFVIKICAVPLAVGRLRIFPLFVYPSEELFICGENRETGRGFLSCATPKRGPEHGINLTTPTFCNKKKIFKGSQFNKECFKLWKVQRGRAHWASDFRRQVHEQIRKNMWFKGSIDSE